MRAVDRAAKPLYSVWELTLQCDLACRHCGSRAGRKRPDELTTAEALDLVGQLRDLGVKEISLIGGEAYLHEGWFEVGKAIDDAGMSFTMVTGGRGINAGRSKQLADAGANAVGISIDGLEELHDELRAFKGSYKAAVSAIGYLQAEGIDVNVNTQITRQALRQVEPMLDHMMDLGIYGWQVQMTVPMGRAADEPDRLLQPYQVLEVLPLVARCAEKARRRDVEVVPGNDIGYFGPYESQIRPFNHNQHRLSCTAGRETMGIEANGSIKGCPSLPSADYIGGNIRDASLEDIWHRAKALQFTRDRSERELWGFCKSCYYRAECLGGCSWTAHVLFGKRGNNPYCHHRALELLREGKRERIVQVERAPGKPFDYGRFKTIVEKWPKDELRRARELAESGEGFLLNTP